MYGTPKESITMTLYSSSKKKNRAILPKATFLPDSPVVSFPLHSLLSSSSETFSASASPNGNYPSSAFSGATVSSTKSSRKRPQAKLPYSYKKKSKMKSTTDEEQNIDSDILALVKNLEPSHSSDSDSSRDTIILIDDDTDASSTEHSDKKCQSSSRFPNSTFTFPNLFSSSSTSLLKKVSDISPSLSKFKDIESHKTCCIADSGMAVEKLQPRSLPQSCIVDSTPDVLLPHSQKPSVLPTSKSENLQGIYSRSIYAEMGLDEDLCDVKAPKTASKYYPIQSLESQAAGNSFSSLSCSKVHNVQIKKEKDTVDQSSFLIQSQGSNDVHVSMTFEADPYDNMDDDLPLSFLKNRSVGEEYSSESGSLNDKSSSSTPIVKKELIDETEIASASNSAITDLKGVAAKKSSFTQASETGDLSQKFLQLPVKIKSEPIFDDFLESSQNLGAVSSNTIMQETINTSAPKKSKNRQKKSSLCKKKQNSSDEQSFISNSFKSENNQAVKTPVGVNAVRECAKFDKLNAIDPQRSVIDESNFDAANTSSETVNVKKPRGKGKKRGKQNKTSNLVACLNDSPAENCSDKSEASSPITLLIKKKKPSASGSASDTFLCTNLPKSTSENYTENESAKVQSLSINAGSSDFEENFELAQIREFLSKDSSVTSKPKGTIQQAKTSKKGKKGSKKNTKSKGKNASHLDLEDTEGSVQVSQRFDSELSCKILHSSKPNAPSSGALETHFKDPNKIDQASISLKKPDASPGVSTDFLEKLSSIKKEPDSSSYSETSSLFKSVDMSSLVQIKKEPIFSPYKCLESKDNPGKLVKTIEKSVISSEPHSPPNPTVVSNSSLISSIEKNTPLNSPSISTTTSESTITPIKTSKSPAKKKRRRVKNNWYKKKRARKDVPTFDSPAISDSEETVSAFDSDSSSVRSMCQNTNVAERIDLPVSSSHSKSLFQKTPVVFVKNLTDNVDSCSNVSLSQSRQLVDGAMDDNNAINVAPTLKFSEKELPQKQSIEEPNVHSYSEAVADVGTNEDELCDGVAATKNTVSPKKVKRKRKGSNKKRIKKTAVAKNKVVESAFESVPITNNNSFHLTSSIAESATNDDNDHKNSCVESANTKSVGLNQKLSHSNDEASSAEVITIDDSPVKVHCSIDVPLWTPTLNTASIYKEIAGIENYVAAKGLAKKATSKNTLNSDDINKRLTLNSDSSQKVDLENNINSSFIQIKKEKELETYSTSSILPALPCTSLQNDSLLRSTKMSSPNSELQQMKVKKQLFNENVDAEFAASVHSFKNREQIDILPRPEPSIGQTKITDLDGLALSIKKEACDGADHSTRPVSSIKNVSELIEKSAAAKTFTEKMQISSNSNVFIKRENDNEAVNNNFEDDVQIIDSLNHKAKNVECVDLTDEPLPAVRSEISKSFTESLPSSSLVIDQSKESVGSCFSIFDKPKSGEEIKDNPLLNNASNDLLSHILDEDTDIANERKTIDLALLKQKYIEEYLTYPYPPSVSFHHKQRNSKMYSRMTRQTLNLSIKTVESRLKATDNVKNQFGIKMGDTVKLDKYPVSISEVECYHRILGVAPSHKLLSKCFKPSENTLGSTNSLDLTRSAMSPDVSKSFQDRPRNLIDVIQAINAKGFMGKSFNCQDPNFLQNDHPSNATKDDFASVSEDNDLPNTYENSDSVNRFSFVREKTVLQSDPNSRYANSLDNTMLNASENNSSLTESNFMPFEPQKFQQSFSETFPDSEISSNEVLGGMNNPEANNHSSLYLHPNFVQEPQESLQHTCYVDTSGENFPVATTSDTAVHSNNLQNTVADKMEVDWDALRNIVNVIKVVGGGITENEVTESQPRETFEYNHTRFPFSQSEYVEHVESYDPVEASSNVCEPSSSTHAPCDKSSKQHFSEEDDYVDNEPINVSNDDSEVDERYDSEESEETKKEEVEPKTRIYKSKWEKIMERKALEGRKTKDINEHLLKDCFPVSSKVPSKKMNTLAKGDEKNLSKISTLEKDSTPSKSKSDREKPLTSKSKLKKREKAVTTADSKSRSAKDLKIKGKPDVETEPDKELFTPDQVIKKSADKKADKTKQNAPKTSDKQRSSKSKDNQTKKFYGNRITNRGQFLTESAPSYLKNIKIPKKIRNDSSKKPKNPHSEEYHSLVDSPNLDLSNKNSTKGQGNKSYYDSYNKRRVELGRKIPSLSNSYNPPNKVINRRYDSEFPSRKSSISENNFQQNMSLHPSDIQPNTSSGYKRPFVEAPKKSLIEVPLQSLLEAPKRPLLEVPKRPLLDAPKMPLLEAPKRALLEAPKRPLLEAPKRPLLETPKRPLLEAPKTTLLEMAQPYQWHGITPSSSIHSSFMHQKEEIIDPRSSNNSTPQLSFSTPSECSSYEFQPDSMPFPAVSETVHLKQTFPDEREAALFNAIHSLLSKGPMFNNSNLASVGNVDMEQNHLSAAQRHNYAETPGASAFPINASPSIGAYPASVSVLNAQNPVQESPSSSFSFSTVQDPQSSSLSFSTVQEPPSSSFSFLKVQNPVQESPSSSLSFLNVQNPVQESPSSSFNFQDKQSFFKGSSVRDDSAFPHPTSVHSNVVTSTTASSTCLVPPDLKSFVGKRVIQTSDVQLLMLEWSVSWLVQQQKFHDPPPISSCLRKVASCYDGFESHYNTYFPLLLLDTWHRLFASWQHLNQSPPYFCDISSYSVKNTHVIVECQTVFNTAAHPKPLFPDEGSMLMVKYGTKSKDFSIKILGYVTHVKTRRFNPVTDSRLGNFKPPKDGNFDTLQVITLSFMGAFNSEDIDKRLPVRIQVLCNVKPTLKQNDALLNIDKSPLLYSILNPVEGGLISVSLIPRNSTPEKVDDCVRSITRGILSPHPLPLLTIVKVLPESDRLNIIPLLIEKMKTAYKTKVLLCVRTMRALSDVAANICLHEDLKMVIVNKRCDTSPQFQKYLLDELVAVERNSVDTSWESLHAKNEAIIRTKKQVFQNCDVILSLVRNCHDEFMEDTFVENENVAQMCCIVDEANLCTEPETLIPMLYGISKLILIGNPDYPAKVVSKTASSFKYDHSLFHRAYDLDLSTE